MAPLDDGGAARWIMLFTCQERALRVNTLHKAITCLARFRLVSASCATLGSFLAGCAVGPDFVRPAPPEIQRYTRGAEPVLTTADRQDQRFERGARVVGDWWLLFLSARLDAAVKEALVNNPGVEAAEASLRQSSDNLRAGYGVFFPQADAGFDATRQRFSPARFGGSSPSTIFNLFTLSATVTYALDVFGGERRTVEGLQAQEEVQRALVRGAYLTLTGNVVTTTIARAAYWEQIRATQALIVSVRAEVRLAETQVEAGTVPYATVLTLRSQLAAVEATLPPLRQRFDQAGHLLATLAGRAPAEYDPPRIDLDDLRLPPDLPITLPSDLVRRRPDILAAEAELHAASAAIGVATAALFPTVTLNGSYGQNNSSMSSLFAGGSNFWSIGADASAPLFHGGTLWFKRKGAIEGYRQAVATYRQTVLGAFSQVADVLRALEHDAEALQAQSRSVSAAEETMELVSVNYRAGTVGYMQLLVANGQLQQARLGHIQARAQRLQDTVTLFVALGGGWRDGGEKIPAELRGEGLSR